jgi:hypothetical protein
LVLSPRPEASSFSIDLLDAAGNPIAQFPFEPKRSSDILPGEDETAVLSEVVSFVPDTERIAISKDGISLASRAVSDNEPQVNILSPNGGENLSEQTATVQWEASDADGDPLSYSLLFSTDAGNTWQTLSVGITEAEQIVNLEGLPGSDRALFRVIATDGVNTGIDDSDAPFTVPFKPPRARIVGPGGNADFFATQTVVFSGEASDLQEGTLSDEALQWRSNIDGLIGVGRSIVATRLTPGSHTVTLAATNSTGLVGNASIQIEIISITPISNILQLPTEKSVFSYHATSFPVRSESASETMPIGVGSVAAGGGTLDIRLGVNQTSGPVDVYLAFFAPSIDPANIYLFRPDNTVQTLAAGLVPWKAAITGPVSEVLFGDIPVSALPAGTYQLYLLAEPAGSGLTGNFYLWVTSFVVP